MPPASDLMPFVVAAAAGTAAVIDLRTRRIPNVVSAGIAAIGILLAVAGWSGITPGSSVLGAFVGLLMMLPGRLFGATGGGDVKLMAAVGTVIGVERMPVAFIGTALSGGALAVAIAIRRRRLGITLGSTSRILLAPSTARATIESPGARNSFSYGPAIAAGAMLAAWLVR